MKYPAYISGMGLRMLVTVPKVIGTKSNMKIKTPRRAPPFFKILFSLEDYEMNDLKLGMKAMDLKKQFPFNSEEGRENMVDEGTKKIGAKFEVIFDIPTNCDIKTLRCGQDEYHCYITYKKVNQKKVAADAQKEKKGKTSNET